MSKLEMIKLGLTTLAGVSTSFTVKTVIANNLEDPQSAADAVRLGVGTVMCGVLAAQAAREYTDKLVDEVAEIVQKVQDSKKSKEQVQS